MIRVIRIVIIRINKFIKNQKIRDIIIILKIYRSHIDDESKDEVISLIKKNLNDKTEWLNQRIQNNNKKHTTTIFIIISFNIII